ncbi:type III secretion system needle complex protein [Burkholderia ubonensis]|uniref:type III secretion system needle complex protein n=1 Tax=Burkholderia ubonensis TaxID=101571 RepID=UPI00075CF232|nr:type III secretion system needle complex protein [Burkholderia ubonensis]KVN41156.1 type III secretion system protein PrgI [Burkholderia ubonensis]
MTAVANPQSANPWNGYLTELGRSFDSGVTKLNEELEQALIDLTQNPSDPALLAAYQSKLSEYSLYRNAQSNVVKVFKDIDAAIVQNFR